MMQPRAGEGRRFLPKCRPCRLNIIPTEEIIRFGWFGEREKRTWLNYKFTSFSFLSCHPCPSTLDKMRVKSPANGNIQYSLVACERDRETQLITGFFTFTLDNGYLHNNLTLRLLFINKHMCKHRSSWLRLINIYC